MLPELSTRAKFEFYIAIDNHHDVVGSVDEILPTLAGRVGPEAATETAFCQLVSTAF